MKLAPGTRIGTYEVLSPLGAGGMGEVYRARDTRLDREVAIKLLPDDVAHDPERLARFEREARLLAAVHHAHVATLFGLEEHDGRRVLVMECVAGETLAQRLARGPLPVAEAVGVCRQIALGLEAAHEAGIIHRDLKPANVMITPEGDAKVLDFGLARGGLATGSTSGDLSHSPTMSVMGTAAGVILGTAAYMSPEQARGRPVDRRTDVWALGCVLYECLTGRQAFAGETISDVVARILEREPDWASLPASAPPALREVLERCLAKDPRARLRDIGDARLEMERSLTAPIARPRAATFAWWPLLAALAVGAAGAFVGLRFLAPPSAPSLTHLSIEIPRELQADPDFGVLEGRGLVFQARPRDSSGTRTPGLYLRAFDGHDAVRIDGSDDARDGSASPDGRWLVLRVPAPGDPSRSRLTRTSLIGDATSLDLGAWDESWASMCVMNDGETLTLSQDGSTLTRVSGSGKRAPPAQTDLGDFRGYMDLVQPLPGDRAVLVHLRSYVDQGWTPQVGVLDLRTLRLRVVVERGGSPSYDGHGHLVFARADQLLAVSFDPTRLETRGDPVAVLSGIRIDPFDLVGQYALDAGGNLYFRRGGISQNERHLGVVDAAGTFRRLPIDARRYHYWISSSRDGRRFVVRVINSEGIDEAWVGESDPPSLRRRLSMQRADVLSPILSADGMHLVYSRLGRDSLDGVYLADADGTDLGTRIIPVDSAGARFRTNAWSADQRFLLIERQDGPRPGDLWCAKLNESLDAVEAFVPLLSSSADERSGTFSPDDRWVLYVSDEAGKSNAYIAPFDPAPRLGRPTRLNSEETNFMSWPAGGRTIVLRLSNGSVVRAPLSVEGRPSLGPATRWFDRTRFVDDEVMGPSQALAIEAAQGETDEFTSVDVILGWARTLPAKMAAARR